MMPLQLKYNQSSDMTNVDPRLLRKLGHFVTFGIDQLIKGSTEWQFAVVVHHVCSFVKSGYATLAERYPTTHAYSERYRYWLLKCQSIIEHSRPIHRDDAITRTVMLTELYTWLCVEHANERDPWLYREYAHKAATYARQLGKGGPHDDIIVEALDDFTAMLLSKGGYKQAYMVAQEVYQMRLSAHGPGHVTVLTASKGLMNCLIADSQWEAAEGVGRPLYTAVLAANLDDKYLEEDCAARLADIVMKLVLTKHTDPSQWLSKLAEAEELARKSVRMAVARLGEDDSTVAHNKVLLAGILQEKNSVIVRHPCPTTVTAAGNGATTSVGKPSSSTASASAAPLIYRSPAESDGSHEPECIALFESAIHIHRTLPDPPTPTHKDPADGARARLNYCGYLLCRGVRQRAAGERLAALATFGRAAELAQSALTVYRECQCVKVRKAERLLDLVLEVAAGGEYRLI
jgi:hypothetical protein